jgi:tetratricopeptide (TPR) repeat protein
LWLQNKQMEAVLTLEKGFERYPKMKEIVSNLYEFNKELKRYENNRQVLTKATVNNPADIDYWILLAITYEDLAELKSDLDKNNVLDSAKIAYKKALELNPNDDVASSNLGILLYNQGVNIINTVSIDTDIVGIGEIQGKALVMFKESLPYMLKAFELNPKRKETLKGLENIYHIIGEFDKSNQFKLLYQKESE